MAGLIDVEVKGLIELQHKTIQMMNDLHGAPIVNAMRDSLMVIVSDARKDAPVDTGRLRSSILPEIRDAATEVQGVVGSNVVYAPYIEFGTRPHFPPISAIRLWVHHKGMAAAEDEGRVAFLIARKIARTGTKAQPFLMPAFAKNETAIRNRFGRAVEVIVNK